MKKSAFSLLALSLLVTSLFAQPDPEEMNEVGQYLDSMIANYNYKVLADVQPGDAQENIYGFAPEEVPDYPDSVYARRIKDLASPIPLEYNSYVKAYIDLYVKKRRDQVERMLGLKYVYFPIFEQALDREGMPIEFRYLPIVESALNPHARSRVGATGLWQFMHNTAKLYGLQITSYVDERRDPYKSTEAAIKYLRQSYKIYGDWLLSIASYNCGPGNVNKAIVRSGGKKTFWEVMDYLPRETRGYVPAFIAAAYVFNYHKEHNLYPQLVDFSFNVDTLQFVRQKITLRQISEMTGCDYHVLKDLNPELKTDEIPYSAKPYTLRVPFKVGVYFAENRDSINEMLAELNETELNKKYASEESSPNLNHKYIKDPNQAYTSSVKTANGTLVYYTVRSGDVVGSIAQRYGCSAKDVAYWNGLNGYKIYPGQKLKIYVSGNVPSAPEPKPQIVKSGNATYYTVRSGDTLWDIAQKYEGLTVEKIKSLNNLSTNSLQPGQKLRIN